VHRYAANTQLKLLFYIILVGVGVYLIQDRYNIFKFESSQPKTEQVEQRTVRVEKVNGESIPIEVEVADTESERSKGLMDRETMEANKGMLFIFENDSFSGFWMKNTLISLDMIFIDNDEKIVYIEHEAQPCEEDPCRVYSPGVTYRYVVEVNGGWVERNSVKIGDTVNLTSGS
jgi:uncharacterized membrane protein (UPF0127 family)